MHTIPVAPRCREVAEARLERAGRRRGRLGQGVGMLESVPELVGAQLDTVDELLVTEADGERHDLDAERVDEWCREIARAVGDHSYPHGQ